MNVALLWGLLSVAAQVEVGDAVGALDALGDHLPGEAAEATLLRARAWAQLGDADRAWALLDTVDDAALLLPVSWLRIQLRDDRASARVLLPPANVDADVHLEAALHLARTPRSLRALLGEPLVAPRALARLYAKTADGRWLRRLQVEHGASPEGRRAAVPKLSAEENGRRAEVLFRARAYDLAIPAFERAVKEGDAQRAHLRLATIHMRLRERYPEALEHATAATRGPDGALTQEAGYRRGLVLGNLRQWDQAIATMRTVRGRYTTRAAYQVGRLLHQSGRYRQAMAAHEVFLKRKLRDPNKYRWFHGWSAWRDGDCARATEIWRPLADDPNLLVGAKALYWQGRCGHEASTAALLRRAPYSYYGHLAGPAAPGPVGRVIRPLAFAEGWKRMPLAVRRLPWDEGLAGRDSEDIAAAYRAPHLELARAAGRLHGVSAWWLLSHMLQESRYQSRSRSHAGALGPMQVLPRTGRRIAERMGFPAGDFLPSELYAPGVALRHAAWYLAALRHEFRGNLLMAVAAYNGGPRRVAEHLRMHRDLPFDVMVEEIGAHETRNYARKVADHIVRYGALYATDAERRSLYEALRMPDANPVPRGELRF